MNLLFSETRPIEAALDRALPWSDSLDDEPVCSFVELEALDGDELTTVSRRPAWYEPRIAELRRLIAGC